MQVLQLLADNLASTPQSLGDAKKESTEELQDRHERVLAATCTALASLIDLAEGGDGSGSGGASGTASQAEAAPRSAAEQELLDGVGQQLQQPAFYKAVLQSKAAAVRRQAYLLVSAAAARRPALLAPAVRAAAPAVLGALGDKEPGTHETLWAMLLAYARAFPASWHNINMQASSAGAMVPAVFRPYPGCLKSSPACGSQQPCRLQRRVCGSKSEPLSAMLSQHALRTLALSPSLHPCRRPSCRASWPSCVTAATALLSALSPPCCLWYRSCQR